MRVSLQKSGQRITLGLNDYIAGGGEGKVYGKGSSAFKLYHDPKKMIPLGKIHELSKLSPKNVLVPRDIVLDSKKKPIGFSMRLIPDSVFLTWLFNRGWKQQNGVSDKHLLDIVKKMRETTITLHNEKCVVGDYNEMQFLVAKDYSDIFFVDADSYQTASFPCTAIMDTVRDRTVPFGTFNPGTDWFAYAIVTFQLWTGIHPYMCKHPSYSKRDAKDFKMMEDGISAYSPQSSLPKQALPLSVIPPDLNSWYKEVFVNGDRSTPPIPGVPRPLGVQRIKKVMSNGNFDVKLLEEFDRAIQKVFCIYGHLYCMTDNAIYQQGKVISHISTNREYYLSQAAGSYEPIIVKDSGGLLELYSKEGSKIDEATADAIMAFKGKIYSVKDGNVYIHNTCSIAGQLLNSQDLVDQVYGRRNIKTFPGTIYSDVLGVPWFLLPKMDGSTQNIQTKSLEGHRIISAKYDSNFNSGYLMVISEKGGKYYRVSFLFKDNNLTRISTVECQPGTLANFIILDKGIVVYISEDDLVLEMPLVGSKVVSNPPFDQTVSLYTDGSRVLVSNDSRLLHVSMI